MIAKPSWRWRALSFAYNLTLVLAQCTVDQTANAERRLQPFSWQCTNGSNGRLQKQAWGGLSPRPSESHLRAPRMKIEDAHVESSHWSLLEVLLSA